MIYFLNALVLATMSFISISFLPYFRLFQVIPMISLFFVITLAYFRKGFEPLIMAAFTGLFFDLSSSNPFGFYLTLFLGATAIVRYLFAEKMRTLSFWHYVLFCEVLVILFFLAQLTNLYFLKINLSIYAVKPLLPLVLINTVFIIICYVFAEWYFDFINRLEDRLKRR